MKIAARRGAMVAAILGADRLPSPVARTKRGKYTAKLLRKFRRKAIERYGLAVVERKGKGLFIRSEAVSADDRRRLRNARKVERRAAR